MPSMAMNLFAGMSRSPIARRVVQGAGAGLAAGLARGYAMSDPNNPNSSGVGHYVRNALGGAAIGAGLGAGVGALQGRLAGRAAVRRQFQGPGASIAAPRRQLQGPGASTAALPAGVVLPRPSLQLPSSTGYNVAPRGQIPVAPTQHGSVSMGPMPARQSMAYTVGVPVVGPQMRLDERYTMGGATMNHLARPDTAYKLGAERALALFS